MVFISYTFACALKRVYVCSCKCVNCLAHFVHVYTDCQEHACIHAPTYTFFCTCVRAPTCARKFEWAYAHLRAIGYARLCVYAPMSMCGT